MKNPYRFAPLLLGLVALASPASAQAPQPSASALPAAPGSAVPEPGSAPAVATPPVEAPATMPDAPAPPAADRSSVGPTVALVGFAFTAAGIVVGTIAGGLAVSKTSTLRDECGGTVCPKSKQDAIDSARNMAGLSTVSFVLAGIGAVVGINGLLVWNADRRSEKAAGSSTARVQWRPVLGLTSAGIEGSF